MHARHVRAKPSGVRAEPLNATADNRFPQTEQVFLATISGVTVFPLRVRSRAHGAMRSFRFSIAHLLLLIIIFGLGQRVDAALQN